MSARRLVGLFVIALLAMLALLWPLRLALGAFDLQAQRLAAIEARGSVWNGTLRDTRWRGTVLGDVAVALRPLSSLVGTHRVALQSDSAAAVLARGGVQGIEHLHGEFASVRIASMPGIDVHLRFDDATLTFADGRCREATGSMQAEVRLSGIADALAAPVLLAGDIACENRTGTVTLSTTVDRAPGTPDIDATLEIDADGSYRLRSQVQADDDVTRLLLQANGFQDGPVGFSRVDSGTLFEQ